MLIVRSIIFLFLFFSYSVDAQNINLEKLNQETASLYREGKFSQAVIVAQYALEVAEKLYGLEHAEMARALNNLAALYVGQGKYAQAEQIFKRALAIREKTLGPDHSEVAQSLNNLASLHEIQGQYVEAESLHQRALAIREKRLGPNHPDVTVSLNNLAVLYYVQGKYALAEPFYRRALAIKEKALGLDHRSVAISLNNLALLHKTRGQYTQSELLYKRALAINEKALGPDHPDVAASLNNLAGLYSAQGEFAQAEPLYKRSLAILEKSLGLDHPDVATSLNNLAVLYETQGQYAQTEALYVRALSIRENIFGANHSAVANSLNNLAALHKTHGQYARAEPLYKRSLVIWEKTLGSNHPNLAVILNNLAVLHDTRGQYAQAEPLYMRALSIREKAFGPDHPDVASSLNNLALLYAIQGQYAKAEPLYKRSLAIWEKAVGPNHPDIALSLNNLAGLHRTQGQYAQAEPLHMRALAIREKVFGPNHPLVAQSLNNLAELHRIQGQYAQAEPLHMRSLAIREKVFGPNHPSVATSLNNLGELFRTQGQYAQAEPLHIRSLAIWETALGPDHPDVALSLHNLAVLYDNQGKDAAAMPMVRLASAILAKRASLAANSDALSEQRRNQRGFLLHLRLLNRSQKTNEANDTAEATQVIQLARASDTSAAVAQMATRFSSGNNDLASLIRSRQDFRARLDALDKRLLEQFGKAAAQRQPALEQGLRDDMARTNTEFDALSATLVERFPQYAELAGAQPLALAEAQKLLKPDEALLAWVFGKDEGFLLAVRAGQAALVRLPVPIQRLRDDVATLRRSLDVQRLQPFPAALANRLYRDLIGPAEGLIGDAKHIFVVPDGPLESLPLSVLLTEAPVDARDGLAAPEALRDAPWLTRKWAVSTLPSISSLKALRVFAKESGATRPFLGIGDPLLDDHPQNTRNAGAASKPAATAAPRAGIALATLFRGATTDVRAVGALPSLPETAGELQAMAQALGAGNDAVVLRAAATETEVKRMTLSNNRVVAFATHGAMAGEIAQLKLDADWVILSACNTAAGDGTPGAEGLSGLAKAFIYAGARALLVSHWPVASEPTVALTTRMLSESAKPGVGRAEAHRRAMLAYLADPANLALAHPAYWAGFAVIGEGGMTKR